MNIPGLLIEYIINGIIAFIWIFIALLNFSHFEAFLKNNVLPVTLLIIPSAYVLGMLIDSLAYITVKKTKKKIKNKEITRPDAHKIYRDASAEKLRELASKSSITDNLIVDLNLRGQPKVVDEIKWRSSRDRIARGFIFNSFFIGLTLTFTICDHTMNHSWLYYSLGIAISLLISLLFWGIWMRFEKMSFRFQLLAHLKIIDNIGGISK